MNEAKRLNVNASFKYKNDIYYLLLNGALTKYFLKDINGRLDYITIEEYVDIMNNIFYPKSVMRYSHMLSVTPFIKVKKKVIPFSLIGSMILSFNGCLSKMDTSKENLSTTSIEIENGSEISNTKNELSNIGIDVEEISDITDDYYLYYINGVKSNENNIYNNTDYSPIREALYNKKCTPDTFGEYLDKKDITFDDLREVTNENNNIPADIKKTIIEGINNLEKNGFDMNHAVLYYNLKRMTFEHVNSNVLHNSAAQFEMLTSKVLINDDFTNYRTETLLHEILGHGSTMAYIEEKGVICKIDESYILLDKEGRYIDNGTFGRATSEGIADIIASKAMGKPATIYENSYSTFVYALSLFCSTLDISMEEFANKGIDILIERMKENKISEPYLLINSLDNIYHLVSTNTEENNYSTELYIMYIEQLINSGMDKNKILESTYSYKEYVVPELSADGVNILGFGSPDSSYDLIEPDIISEYVKKQINVKSY